jgi:deoxyribose-phosphate aldolase
VDQVGVEERVARLNSRSVKKQSKVAALKLALSMIDLTTLEGSDSPGKVRQLCYKPNISTTRCPTCRTSPPSLIMT